MAETIVDDQNIKQVVQSQLVRLAAISDQWEHTSDDLSEMGKRITKHRDELSRDIRTVADTQLEMKGTLDQISRQLNGRGKSGHPNGSGRFSKRDSLIAGGAGVGTVSLVELAQRLFFG